MCHLHPAPHRLFELFAPNVTYKKPLCYRIIRFMIFFCLHLVGNEVGVSASVPDEPLQAVLRHRQHAWLRWPHVPIYLGPYMDGRIGSHGGTTRTRRFNTSPSLPRPKEGSRLNMIYPNTRHKIPGSRPAHIRPPRHEQCETNLDCLHAPNQICVKHARERYGRCQCPFYRPVEISVDGKLRCITAKDIYDECSTDLECQATQEHLQCVNHLCNCTAPFLLQEDNTCRAPRDLLMRRESYMSYIAITATVLGTLLVSGAALLITKTYKKSTGSDSTRNLGDIPLSDSCNTNDTPFKPRQSKLLKLMRKPVLSPDKLRKWAYHTRPLFGTVVPGTAPATAENLLPAQSSNPLIKLWAQKAFRSMASPLYQTNLISNVPQPPAMKPSSVEPDVHRTLSIEMPVSAEYPLFSSDHPFSPMTYGDFAMSKKRPPPPVAMGLPLNNRSEDIPSFKSYIDSVDASLEDELTMRLKQTRRQLSSTFFCDDFSCDDETTRGRKKVASEMD